MGRAKVGVPFSQNRSPQPLTQRNPITNPLPTSATQNSTQIKSTGAVRRLTDKEMQEKREKGLCFRCDRKWTVGHRCARRELSILCAQKEDEAEEEFFEVEDVEGEEESPTISLNSVLGISSPKTMKMRGTVLGQEVIVMVDPGATHNFISLGVVEKLGLPISLSKSFGVSLGTGDAVHGEGECIGVRLQLQGVEIVENYLPLTLGNSDLILGIEWLEKLGTMTANWKMQTLRFELEGREVTLTGEPSLGRTLISLKAMIRTLRKEGGGYLVEFNYLSGGEEEGQGSN